jgi:hypothetical protein
VSNSVPWADRPPIAAPAVRRRLISPRSVAGFQAVLLSRCLVCVPTHWIDGRTRPCAGQPCWCHAENVVPKWKGFAACLVGEDRQEFLLELTAGACEQILNGAPDQDNMRGLVVNVRRRDRRQQAPVDVEILRQLAGGSLPPAFDVLAVLLKVWGIRVGFASAPPSIHRAAGPDPLGKIHNEKEQAS